MKNGTWMFKINKCFRILAEIEILFKNLVLEKMKNDESTVYHFSFSGKDIEGEKGIYKFRFSWRYKPEGLSGYGDCLDAYCLRIDLIPPYGNVVNCIDFNRGSNDNFGTYEHFTPATIDITGRSLEKLSIYDRGIFRGDHQMDDIQLILSNDKNVCHTIISWEERLELIYKSLSSC